MYRVLAKVGFDTRIPDYDKFYRTPTSANTGTYLHQVHHDFGAAGILIIPFCIGLLCTRVRSRFLSTGGYAALALLGHLYAAVGISYFVGASRLGYWLVSLLASVTLGAYLDMRRRRPAAR
jgi:hypothetical protein